jgi:hypothetical protein
VAHQHRHERGGIASEPGAEAALDRVDIAVGRAAGLVVDEEYEMRVEPAGIRAALVDLAGHITLEEDTGAASAGEDVWLRDRERDGLTLLALEELPGRAPAHAHDAVYVAFAQVYGVAIAAVLRAGGHEAFESDGAGHDEVIGLKAIVYSGPCGAHSLLETGHATMLRREPGVGTNPSLPETAAARILAVP